jgi:uncharacterized protein
MITSPPMRALARARPPFAALPVRPLLLALALALALVPASACRNGRSGGPGPAPGERAPAAVATPVVVLQASGRAIPVRVELARTEAERSRGLMFRSRLDPDAGMLFLFPRPGRQMFWMKNTLIPLDMIFIGADRRIVGIVEEAVPGSLQSRGVEGESQFVLEIAGGLARRWGVSAGSAVEFQGVSTD